MKGCNRLLLILFLLFFVLGQSHAQSNNNNSNTTTNDMFGLRTTFNSSTAVVIVVLISAFLFIIFFSMYVRQCGGRAQTFDPSSVASRPRRQQGLAPEVIKTFPTLVYSEVKGVKIGTDALECAVCLSEFDGGETLRLLPVCSHVFHPDCIDAWLASHVTCPLCRRNLAGAPKDGDPAEDEAAVEVEEAVELDRIASRRRPAGFPRSHSTGHSLNHDRFTLRLPEEIRREIVAGSGGGIQRAASVRVGSRRGRSVRLGRSGNWASAFGRNFSARVPAWSAARRWDDEGKIWSVRSKIDGDGAKREDAGDQRV